MVVDRSREPSVQQLRLLVVLAEELHFGRTARRVHMSQPAVSRQVAALEVLLGVQLFERGTRRVALTGAGQALIESSRAVIQAADELLTQATRQASYYSERVVIGSFEAVSALPPISRVLAEVRALYPQLGLQIRRLGFDFSDAILEGEVDAAFVFLPVPEGIQVQPLTTGARCLAISSNDVLATEAAVTLTQLGQRPVIGISDRAPDVWRRFWTSDPRPDGSSVYLSDHAVTDFDSVLALVALGEGVQFPPAESRYLYPRPGVAYIDVTDLPVCSTAFAWLPKNRDRPVVRAIRHLARVAHNDGLAMAGEP